MAASSPKAPLRNHSATSQGLIGFPVPAAEPAEPPSPHALELAEHGLEDLRDFLESMRGMLSAGSYDWTGRFTDLHNRARCEMRKRQMRNTLLGEALFANPAWDILLLLFSELPRRQHLLIRDFPAQTEVPLSTTLRWLALLESKGWSGERRISAIAAPPILALRSAAGISWRAISLIEAVRTLHRVGTRSTKTVVEKLSLTTSAAAVAIWSRCQDERMGSRRHPRSPFPIGLAD